MNALALKRIAKTPPQPTFGVLLEDGIPFAVTLERPDLGNAPHISCFPDGDFACRRFHSAKHPDTFEITGVPGRSALLFHAANVMEELEGCVAVGEQYGILNGEPAILQSGAGFREFQQRTRGWSEFILHVVTV